jgi:acetylornithine deacetylase/succinyl-diaminopimelate desuccinylase-like protein
VLGEGGFGLSGLLDRPVMPIVVGEKAPLWLRARARGDAGHASMPPGEQAIRGLTRFVEAVSGPGPARLHPVVREQLAALADAADGPRARVLQLLSSAVGPAAIRASGAGGPRQLRGARPPHRRHHHADAARGWLQDERGARGAEATFDARLLPDTDVDALLDRLAVSVRGTG